MRALPVCLKWVVVPIIHQHNDQLDVVASRLSNHSVHALERLYPRTKFHQGQSGPLAA